jgi:hypothetical protein
MVSDILPADLSQFRNITLVIRDNVNSLVLVRNISIYSLLREEGNRTSTPITSPTVKPSVKPSMKPSSKPTTTARPSTFYPSSKPILIPTSKPSVTPSSLPTCNLIYYNNMCYNNEYKFLHLFKH